MITAEYCGLKIGGHLKVRCTAQRPKYRTSAVCGHMVGINPLFQQTAADTGGVKISLIGYDIYGFRYGIDVDVRRRFVHQVDKNSTVVPHNPECVQHSATTVTTAPWYVFTAVTGGYKMHALIGSNRIHLCAVCCSWLFAGQPTLCCTLEGHRPKQRKF